MKILSTILMALFLSGCMATMAGNSDNIKRVSIKFKASEYNSIANKYTTRLTTAEIFKDKNPSPIRLHMDDYSTMGKYFSIVPEDVDVALDAIDKYLEWNEIATIDGDMIDKEIMTGKYARMMFYSGNEANHYFVIGMKVDSFLGPKIVNPFYFDKENTILLKDFFIAYKNGELKVSDSSKYN
jgi:hypothetical protein